MDADDVRLVRVVPDPKCEWCGAPVSQLGTRTPRKYCKRSHRQRALEARRLGLPMKKDRPKEAASRPAALVRAEEDRQAALFFADAVVRTSVDVPPPAPAADDAPPLPAEPRVERTVLPLWEDAEIGERLAAYGIGPDGSPDWEKRLEYWEAKRGPAAD